MAVITELKKDTQVLSFKLNGKEFAISLDYIQEIASSKYITLMEQPSGDRKIINHKGQDIPIVNIADEVTDIGKDKEQFVIILNYENQKAGILADEISEIINVSSNAIKQAEDFAEGLQEYIYGVSKINNNDLFLLNPFVFISRMNKDYYEN